MCGRSSHGNREILWLISGISYCPASERRGAVADDLRPREVRPCHDGVEADDHGGSGQVTGSRKKRETGGPELFDFAASVAHLLPKVTWWSDRLQTARDCFGKLVRRCAAAKVGRTDVLLIDRAIDGDPQTLPLIVSPDVFQHYLAGKQ